MDPNKPLYTLFKDQPFPNDFQFSDTVFGQCKSVKSMPKKKKKIENFTTKSFNHNMNMYFIIISDLSENHQHRHFC